ncbi:hypothetical protein [Microbulbifer sp. TYP-18]|uniref:hypothetical protein n=1 Tax=Microbulbifer sp. TYP-18 TaxID=3230024 RepID=UPI0034C5EEF3
MKEVILGFFTAFLVVFSLSQSIPTIAQSENLGCGVDAPREFPYVMHAKRVRYCRSSTFLCNDKHQDDMPEWEQNGVSDQDQKRTIIATYNAPPVSQVDTLVYLSAGTIYDYDDAIKASNIGTCENWSTELFDHSRYTLADRRIPVLPNSIPHKIATEGDFNMSRTFIAIAMNPQYYLSANSSTRTRIIEAHYQWLKKKFYRSNLKFIYLAGHRRGGALVTHLAAKFKLYSPEIPVLVHLYDPHASWGEFGVSSTGPNIDNPLTGNTSRYGRKSYLESLDFGGSQMKNLLFIDNSVSGDSPQPFVELDTNNQAVGTIGNWYRQNWTSRSSLDLVDSNTDLIYSELVEVYNDFYEIAQQSSPPEARCRITPSFVQGSVANVSFQDNGSYSRSGSSLQSYQWNLSNGQSFSGQGPFSTTFYMPYQEYLFTHTARLTVTDGYGNTDYMTCSVTLQDPDNGECLSPPCPILEPAD